MLSSKFVSRSGEGSCWPMAEIQSLMLTVAGSLVLSLSLTYDSLANLVLGTGLFIGPLQ